MDCGRGIVQPLARVFVVLETGLLLSAERFDMAPQFGPLERRRKRIAEAAIPCGFLDLAEVLAWATVYSRGPREVN